MGGARRAGRADHAGQLVVERACRPVRPGLGDLRLDRCRAAARYAGHRRALDGAVEPRDDALPPARRRQPGRRSMHLLADHVRASAVIVGDGVRPSNSGRGYVLRRLLRRALTTLWREDRTRSLDQLPAELLDHTAAQFGQGPNNGTVREVFRDEERRFAGLLDRGRQVLARFRPSRPLTDDDLAYLHETHGLPPDLVTELLA